MSENGKDEEAQRNVFGEPIVTCSMRPLTGFYRNGCCDTGPEDFGVHTVCVEMTAEFLEFSKAKGNDLSTPRPEFSKSRVPMRMTMSWSLRAVSNFSCAL